MKFCKTKVTGLESIQKYIHCKDSYVCDFCTTDRPLTTDEIHNIDFTKPACNFCGCFVIGNEDSEEIQQVLKDETTAHKILECIEVHTEITSDDEKLSTLKQVLKSINSSLIPIDGSTYKMDLTFWEIHELCHAIVDIPLEFIKWITDLPYAEVFLTCIEQG